MNHAPFLIAFAVRFFIALALLVRLLRPQRGIILEESRAYRHRPKGVRVFFNVYLVLTIVCLAGPNVPDHVFVIAGLLFLLAAVLLNRLEPWGYRIPPVVLAALTIKGFYGVMPVVMAAHLFYFGRPGIRAYFRAGGETDEK